MIETFHNAYQSALDRAVWFDLSSYGKIQLDGSDAVRFLHNLCTNDIKSLPVGGGCEAFLCNPRARTLAHILVSVWGASQILLDMVPGLNTKVLQHLNKFHISEKVEIADRTSELAMLRLVGPLAVRALEKLLGSLPPEVPELYCFPQEFPGTQGMRIRRQNLLGLPGYDLFFAPEYLTQMMTDLRMAGVEPAPPEVHDVLRIEAGLPEYGKEMDDERFVMELGRTAQAICYTKGCFQGQEPIVMARDRGQVNRTLMGVTIAEGTNPASHGGRLFLADAEVGQVTSSVFSPRLGQVIALAYVRRGQQQPGTELMLEPGSDGRKAVVTPLPFAAPPG